MQTPDAILPFGIYSFGQTLCRSNGPLITLVVQGSFHFQSVHDQVIAWLKKEEIDRDVAVLKWKAPVNNLRDHTIQACIQSVGAVFNVPKLREGGAPQIGTAWPDQNEQIKLVFKDALAVAGETDWKAQV